MTELDLTVAQFRAYLLAHNWRQHSGPEFPSHDVWRNPAYGDYPDGGILLPNGDADIVLGRIYASGVLETLARFEGRCEHEVLADTLGEMDAATALAQVVELEAEREQLAVRADGLAAGISELEAERLRLTARVAELEAQRDADVRAVDGLIGWMEFDVEMDGLRCGPATTSALAQLKHVFAERIADIERRDAAQAKSADRTEGA